MENLPFETEVYEEQTELKHKVFREYFDAWVKILGSKFGRLNYIDGFAGLGAYVKEKEVFYGSPIIAAEVLRDNNRFVMHSTLVLIDKDKKTLENLRSVLKYKDFDNCQSMRIEFFNEDFNKAMNTLMSGTEDQNLAPTFAFIDPFGFEGIHFDTIRRIMENINKLEIIINFMFNAVTRFLERDDLKETFTRVFGTDEWQNIAMNNEEREKTIIEFYVSRLKKISKFVFPYRLTFPDKKRTYYYLIHMTNHPLGATIMKSSFAKHSLGKVEWLGENSAQTSLTDILGIKMNEIKNLLIRKYDKKSVSFQQIIVENIDSTPYLESQLKDAIKELETEGAVYIERFPKLGQNGRPLISLQPDTIIHFNCFPNIERKTLLYETKVEYGNFTINHVFGCAHGCNYPCYAFLMSRSYGKAKNYEEWIHPKIVSNALDLLDKEIPKCKDKIDFVHMSFTTDPFMYDSINKRVLPVISKSTLKIMEKLNRENIKVTVLTKGIYPHELADKKKYSEKNEYGITLVSLKDKFKKEFEPFASPFEDRIKSLEFLHNQGLKTWVSMEPYPTPNLIKQDIHSILERIVFADKIVFGKMNYNKEATNFEDKENFYRECSEIVIDFCQRNKKQYHIKKGTPNAENATKELFKDES